MSPRLVSVVMPAYNAERYVARAIESVFAQTYPNLELIVVDDGSTDGTADVLRSYGDRLKWMHQPNSRQAIARNRGVELSAGELIAFLDADDVWLPRKLEKQVALWESRPGLGLVYCSTKLVDENDRPLGDCRADLRGACLRKIVLREYEGTGGSTALVPRSVFEEVGGFDPRLPPCEDSDFLWRVASRYPIDFVDDSLVLYRLHERNSHKDIAMAAAGWELIYHKAFTDKSFRSLGWITRCRAYSRLEYMLAGFSSQGGQRSHAVYHGLRSAFWWPPILPRLLAQSVARFFEKAGAR